jgi:hypothetical protein
VLDADRATHVRPSRQHCQQCDRRNEPRHPIPTSSCLRLMCFDRRLFHQTAVLSSQRTTPGFRAEVTSLKEPRLSVVQKHDQDDQRNRNSEQPKQDRHDNLLSFCLRC